MAPAQAEPARAMCMCRDYDRDDSLHAQKWRASCRSARHVGAGATGARAAARRRTADRRDGVRHARLQQLLGEVAACGVDRGLGWRRGRRSSGCVRVRGKPLGEQHSLLLREAQQSSQSGARRAFERWLRAVPARTLMRSRASPHLEVQGDGLHVGRRLLCLAAPPRLR